MTPPSSENRSRKFAVQDTLFVNVTRLFAVIVLVLLLGIMASLVIGSLPSIRKFGFHFIFSQDWDPVSGKFGAVVPMIGTLATSFIALLIGVPISFGIALFLTELSPNWLKRPLGIAIELLAGIPSIIYGMWGLFVFAPFFGDHIEPWIINTLGNLPLIGTLFQGAPMGIGILSAGLILAIMVIPFIASVMRDVFEIVPPMLKESAYGLGATTWEVVRFVVLPYARIGVVGSIMLGLGRALGETMAFTFIIGNSDQISLPFSLLNPGNSISSALANEFTEATTEIYTSSLIELGLILFFITFVVLSISKLLLMHMSKQEGLKS